MMCRPLWAREPAILMLRYCICLWWWIDDGGICSLFIEVKRGNLAISEGWLQCGELLAWKLIVSSQIEIIATTSWPVSLSSSKAAPANARIKREVSARPRASKYVSLMEEGILDLKTIKSPLCDTYLCDTYQCDTDLCDSCREIYWLSSFHGLCPDS